MSLIPMMYQDWWNDEGFTSPFRSSRLMDQYFGRGLNRNDLLSSYWNPTPSRLRGGYLRPWSTNEQLEDKDYGSTIHMDKDKFQVVLDVQQYAPDDVCVKLTDDKFITIEAKHEEKPDEHGYISRHFVRRYKLPDKAVPKDISSALSSDGVLTITAPMLPQLTENGAGTEKRIPIKHVGQKKIENKKQKIENGGD